MTGGVVATGEGVAGVGRAGVLVGCGGWRVASG